jgi:hypothetical protein
LSGKLQSGTLTLDKGNQAVAVLAHVATDLAQLWKLRAFGLRDI